MSAGVWITFVRGAMALTLGLGLLAFPGGEHGVLLNFMGFYWLSGGVLTIRWGLAGVSWRRFPLLAGALGVAAGALMLMRSILNDVAQDDLVITLIGLSIVVVGLTHVFGGFRAREDYSRESTVASTVLGAFEVILGAAIIYTPQNHRPVLYFLVAAWACLGGTALILEGLYMRRKAILRAAHEGLLTVEEHTPL